MVSRISSHLRPSLESSDTRMMSIELSKQNDRASWRMGRSLLAVSIREKAVRAILEKQALETGEKKYIFVCRSGVNWRP